MTKTLTVSDEAYERLASRKEHGESFSSVIKKLTGRSTILDLAGTLTEKEATELKENIRKTRTRMNKRIRTISEEMKE